MRVNSALRVFFGNRFGGSVPIAIGIAIFFSASSFTAPPDRDSRVKQVNLIIRHIGHQLLLQAGDFTSRVLPVTEIREGTFMLGFENDFVFSHDSLMMLSQRLLPKTEFPSGYTVTVHDCMTSTIVYGFQINNTSPDLLPCRGRSQPPGCYTIEISFPDFYENVEQKKFDIEPLIEKPKSLKVNPEKVIPKANDPIAFGVEEAETATLDTHVNHPIDEPKSFKVDRQETNPTPIATVTEEFKTTTSNYSLISLVSIGMVVVLVVGLLIARFGKILTPEVPVQNQNHAKIKASIPEGSALGKFLFDVKNQRLLPIAPDSHRDGTASEVTNLTDKECKILELLHKNFGELIPRETLMQEVWINEGVITGRSLDMFVSKLRKKLSGDPELRITNVHGKGYKLEISGM